MKKMATQMFNKFLHNSTQNMRQSIKDKDGASLIEAIQNIFEINTDNIDAKQYKNEHHTKGYES
jgi:glutamyl-tRNA reductase